jgi:hypothetical protein
VIRLWPRRRSRWADVDFYALRPERCVEATESAEGNVVLLVPRFRRGPLASWLQARLRPDRAHVRVTLEQRGTWLWRSCDGTATVRDLVEGFRAAFPGDGDQVPERVCQYVYQLARHDFVRFANLPAKGGLP